MKRSWIGFVLLLILLVLGLLVTWGMGRIHEPITQDLERASDYTMLGDWQNASRFFRSASDRWEQWAHIRSCFADHSPVEEIDAGFAKLQVYCTFRENAAFAAECRELAKKVAAVGEAHGLMWWNIL